VQEKVLQLATEMPYERAAELVSELTGVAVSNHHGHATLSRVAESADLDTVIPDESEIRRRIEQAKASAQDKPVLVAALDGAHAPTRSRARRGAIKSGAPASGAKSKAFACISPPQRVA